MARQKYWRRPAPQITVDIPDTWGMFADSWYDGGEESEDFDSSDSRGNQFITGCAERALQRVNLILQNASSRSAVNVATFQALLIYRYEAFDLAGVDGFEGMSDTHCRDQIAGFYDVLVNQLTAIDENLQYPRIDETPGW